MIDFPIIPTLGQQYTEGDRTWECVQVGPPAIWDMVPVSTSDAEAAAEAALNAAASADDAFDSETAAAASAAAAAATLASAAKTADLANPSVGFGADTVANSVRRVDSIAELRAMPVPTRKTMIMVEGYSTPGDAGDAKAFSWVSTSTLADDGLCVITPSSNPTNGRWEWRGVVDPRWAGAVAGGVTNCASAFIAMAAVTKTYKLSWIVPNGDFLVDANQVLQFTTSVDCMGRILIPKSNKICRFEFIRDSAGVVLDTSGWGALNRGDILLNASNALGKNVYLSSTQVLMERIGGSSYLRQEMIRIRGPLGTSTTPLVCTYDDKSKLTATAYEPSTPITVNNLQIVRTGAEGGVETNIGSIYIERDSVTVNSPVVLNPNSLEPISVGINPRMCCDVTINKPRGVGLNYAGLGYGILASVTLGLTVNDAEFGDCRHAFSGRNNVDVRINGGTWGNVIDEHWGDRMMITSPVITSEQGGACVQYAGNDITIAYPVCVGGRTLLAIRLDTPSLGGKVSIIRPTWTTNGETGLTYLFGFTSPTMPNSTAMAIFTQALLLPDLVEIDFPSITSDATLVYLAYLGTLQKSHSGWGTFCLNGLGQRKGSFSIIGVFSVKDSTYQVTRGLRIEMRGPMKLLSTDRHVYLADADSVATRGASLLFAGIDGGSPRFSPFSADSAQFIGGTVHSIVNDKGSGAGTYTTQRYTLTGVELGGGAIGLHSNIAFQQCVINAVYTSMPPNTTGTYIGCVKTPASTIGWPANITNNVVAPFAT